MKAMFNARVFPGIRTPNYHSVMDKIVALTAKEFRVNKHHLFSKTRKREIVDPRRVSMLLIKQVCQSVTLLQIARYFGGEDHSRVIRSIEAVNNLLDTEPELKARVNKLQEMIEINFV